MLEAAAPAWRAANSQLLAILALLCSCWMTLASDLVDVQLNITAKQQSIICYLKKSLEESFMLNISRDLLQLNTAQTCAVISSSGALAYHKNGLDIDSHDIVLRFNDAPTEGYEAYVGGKTDIRFGWETGHFGREGKNYDYKTIVHVAYHACVDVLSYLYPTHYGQSLVVDDPTSGFYGMLLLLFHCGVVDSYEMTPSYVAANSPYHYYDIIKHQTTADSNIWHTNFKAEHELWKTLSTTSPAEVLQSGRTSTPGFNLVDCPAEVPLPGSLEPCPAANTGSYDFTLVLRGWPATGDLSYTAQLAVASLAQVAAECVHITGLDPVAAAPSAERRLDGADRTRVVGTAAVAGNSSEADLQASLQGFCSLIQVAGCAVEQVELGTSSPSTTSLPNMSLEATPWPFPFTTDAPWGLPWWGWFLVCVGIVLLVAILSLALCAVIGGRGSKRSTLSRFNELTSIFDDEESDEREMPVVWNAHPRF